MTARRAGPIAAVEALEEPGQLLFLDTPTVVADLEDTGACRQGQRRAGARVADRVLREVLDDGLQHPAPERELESGSASIRISTSALSALSSSRARTSTSTGSTGVDAERYNLPAALQLGEEEHVVHELCHLLDLLPRLGKQLVAISPGKRRRLQQGEQPGQRRPQLVGDRGRETDPQLLVSPGILHDSGRVWPKS